MSIPDDTCKILALLAIGSERATYDEALNAILEAYRIGRQDERTSIQHSARTVEEIKRRAING